MNVGQLKSIIAAYLQVPVEDTVVNGVDLALLALNNAQKYATRFHDWNCEEVHAYGTATEGKGSWANMTVVENGTESAVRLKQPETFYMQEGDDLIPLYHHRKKNGAVWAKERLEARGVDSSFRYRGDLSGAADLTRSKASSRYEVYVFRNSYEINPMPEEEKTIWVDGFRWMDAYVEDEDEDFFTEHGADFLQYSGIVELNLLFQTFIPQQEGNLAPPERARDDALASLIEYDNFLVESGRQPQRS